MNDDIIDELANELEQLAHDYPEQPQWSDLAHRVRKEAETSSRPPEKRPRASRSSPAEPVADTNRPQMCRVCNVVPAVHEHRFCAECNAIYRMVSARVVAGVCDCGHPADDNKVYVYRRGCTEQTLCSLQCVMSHFRKVYWAFLGIPR